MHISNAPSIIRSLIFITIDSDMQNPSPFPREEKKDTISDVVEDVQDTYPLNQQRSLYRTLR